MSDRFLFDVFVSHSSKDKPDARETAELLRGAGLRVWFDEWVLKRGDNIPAMIEQGLEHSRVLVFCMSINAFGSDWAGLEASTFRFRDPLNQERRFIPLRLDDAPIKGSLSHLLYINWLSTQREQEFSRLLDVCRPPADSFRSDAEPAGGQVQEEPSPLRKRSSSRSIAYCSEEDQTVARGNDQEAMASRAQIRHMLDNHNGRVFAVALSEDCRIVVSGANNGSIKIWDVQTGECLRTFHHKAAVRELVFRSRDRIYGAGEDGTIGVWDFGTGELVATFEGHSDAVYGLALGTDGKRLVSSSKDGTIKVWNAETGDCTKTLKYGKAWVNSIALLPGENAVLAGSEDGAMHLWDIATGKREDFPQLHRSWVWSVAFSPSSSRIVSGSGDSTAGLWDLKSRTRLTVFEGHRDKVSKVAVTTDGRWAVSGSLDGTAIIWDLYKGVGVARLHGHRGSVECVAISPNGRLIVTGADDGRIGMWDFSTNLETEDSVWQTTVYTNAKVLLVGDPSAGKTALTHRLATGAWKPSEDSTVGAWCTQLKLRDAKAQSGVEREMWLWDFGGQADQRLVHQLYMDRAAAILLVFNADQEDILPGLHDWLTALRRSAKMEVAHFLVAGRVDTGFKASRGKLKAFANEEGLAYYETSAKSGEGCDDLRDAIVGSIPWGQMEKRTSPRLFKLIKDEILKLRDEGEALHTFKELRELLWRRLPGAPQFMDETLHTVIGLLDGPGVVKELDYGTYVLLTPEWINTYAQALIRTLRSPQNNLGALPLRSIAEGKLIYQSIGRDGVITEMKRLSPDAERVVLGEMERQLEQRGLCLRQGDKLVFPSYCGRDRSTVTAHPSILVSYEVKGYLDDVYSTLVVRIADSEAFQLSEMWRDAADFTTLVGDRHLGVMLTRKSASEGDIGVYFGQNVTTEEQVIFANYIHIHLKATGAKAQRLRHYVCPYCQTPKGNPEVLLKRLVIRGKEADTECDGCGKRFPLWDALETKFASNEAFKEVEGLQARDLAQLSARRKGKLLVLDVGARITSANQKWMEVPGDEDDGIDISVEFTDEDGNGIGKGLCLQLKAGNSHLTRRKTDGVEIFTIKKPRWVKTWMNQPFPVMLVIGTFPEIDERATGKAKVEFADVRWMEISSVLKRESENGTKPVKQIEFKGERLDLTSVRIWRNRLLSADPT